MKLLPTVGDTIAKPVPVIVGVVTTAVFVITKFGVIPVTEIPLPAV